jgi:hypothetical protein
VSQPVPAQRPPSLVLLLVGPKGAGKTTIGSMLARRLDVAFLRVEPIYLDVVRRHPGTDAAELEPAGFGAILDALDREAANHPVVCLESTATAGFFAEFLRRLRSRHDVRIVRVLAPPRACVARVRGRDATDHIPVSDDRLADINRAAERVELPWDLVLDNSGPLREREIVDAVSALLSRGAEPVVPATATPGRPLS